MNYFFVCFHVYSLSNTFNTGDPFSHHSSSHEKNEKEQSSLTGERIDYNEHFSWEWAQGRFGFGKYAGRFSREFREGVLKGLPYPILQVNLSTHFSQVCRFDFDTVLSCLFFISYYIGSRIFHF